jgi:hypothetical protein
MSRNVIYTYRIGNVKAYTKIPIPPSDFAMTSSVTFAPTGKAARRSHTFTELSQSQLSLIYGACGLARDTPEWPLRIRLPATPADNILNAGRRCSDRELEHTTPKEHGRVGEYRRGTS